MRDRDRQLVEEADTQRINREQYRAGTAKLEEMKEELKVKFKKLRDKSKRKEENEKLRGYTGVE